MASVNKVILVGNLGKDPDVRFTGGGQAVANFSIATTEKWKGKDGNFEEKTEWHNIVVWGKLAELCREYLSKGRAVYVEGRLQTRSWEKDGVKRYTTEVVAQTIQFLGGRGEGAGSGSGGGSRGGMSGGSSGADDQSSPPSFDEDEDIPF